MTQKRTQRRAPPLRGTEIWKTIKGEEFAYWDLWFLVLVVDNERYWQSVIEELKSRRKRVGYEREDAEAKLSHVAYLQQRLDSLKLNAVELLGVQEIDKKLLRKARTKVFEQTVGERDKTTAMRNTPRRLLSARALRGYWDRFPVSPARFESAFLLEINKSEFYYKRATFPLSERIEQILKREEDRSNKSVAARLALYRAFLTSMIGAMEKVDDSFGVIGDLRAKKFSGLSAIVLKWSQARKRYERQGLLVEEKALEEAEASCLADADRRASQAARRAKREAEQDREYIARFAQAIRKRYPGCPAGRETIIAEHACRKYSGRVGRSSDAKELGTRAIDLAVQAHVRHAETNYDELLGRGFERHEARSSVEEQVKAVLDRWFCTV